MPDSRFPVNCAWYHDHNASVSCWPGDGSGKRATPLNVTAKETGDG